MSLFYGWKMPGLTTLPGFIVLTMCIALTFQPTPADAQATASSESIPGTDSLQSSASMGGIVTDGDGDVITGVSITLTQGAIVTKTTSTGDGSFRFSNLPSGGFKLTLSAIGFAPKEISGTLHPGEQSALPQIRLTAATQVNVNVVYSRHDQAEVEVKLEEKQRLAGFLPNYFVTYNWNALPLSPGQKFELTWKRLIDPATFIVDGATAGIEQAQGDFSGYGRGGQGYAKRFGAVVADDAIGGTLGGAVLPILFHQDPRYFYKGTGSFRSRLAYALAASVICKGDNGRWQPNYSSVLGDFSAGAISNLYYPAADRNGASLTLENGLLDIAGDAVENVIQEFIFRKITPHLPKSVSAKQ